MEKPQYFLCILLYKKKNRALMTTKHFNSTMASQDQLCPKHSNNDDQDFLFAFQLVNASVLPMAMRAAINLNVFEIINKAGEGAHLSSSQIASHFPSHCALTPNRLDRLLRLLASYSVLTCSVSNHKDNDTHVERLYGLTKASKYFVKDRDGSSLAPYLIYAQDKVSLDSWYCLDEAILDGGVSFDKVHGMDVYQLFGGDPRFSKLFNRAMASHTTIVMKKIVEKYGGFEGVNVLVDVGGGIGTNIDIIVSKYPSIKGINFDLPRVIQTAPPYPGVEHVGGDMFASVPKGNAIFMKWILHNWSDDCCLKLLKNCYEALQDGGKVIVVEGVIPVVPEVDIASEIVHQMDLIMMNRLSGGKERTLEEFEALAKGSGFAGVRLGCCVCSYWVMEFYK
ncbi:hypothetical protein Sjap_010753 [Stephania japonica]|uniref:Uncharacterized protein n=1 Tax=Stephania japonica TaxID=461633 RepID=A0AAP0JA11_9MAGN|nr:COMT protein [Stephania japonica]